MHLYGHDFRRFIAKHPALNLSALANEMDIARIHMSKIVAGLRTIPKAKCGRFLLIAQKYGYPADYANNFLAFKTARLETFTLPRAKKKAALQKALRY